jgi:peptide/nickel transport system permease protein
MAFARYLGKRAAWYVVVLFVALLLNFLLPRLVPGNPVDAIVASMTRGGGATGEAAKQTYETYMAEFGLDKPLWQQFFIYVGNLFQGDLGTSFGQYPASVNSLIAAALPWSLVLQIPAILVGWIVGNILGAIAAFKGGWFDRGAFLGSLFLTSIPYYCLAILLLYFFGVQLGLLPVGGA